MSDAQAFLILRELSTCFPQSKIAEETIEAYVNALKDIDSYRLGIAAKKLAQTAQFFPTIAELRLAAGEITARSQNSIDPKVFRQTELALIQLNDEFRGGLWGLEQYLIRRAHILEGTGITEEMLEQAKVSVADKHGHGHDLETNWDQLRWRRRSREGAHQDEGT